MKIVALIVLSLGIVIGFLAGQYSGIHQMQSEALKQNLAHYDMRTGDWTWGDATVTGVYISQEQQELIKASCKAKGNKAANDPSCILAGE